MRWGFRGGFDTAARLPFLPLMEEKEAKEDQGNDRHQIGRMGAGSCLGLHEIHPYRRRDLFWPSFYSSGKRKRFVGDFEEASPPQLDFLFFP